MNAVRPPLPLVLALLALAPACHDDDDGGGGAPAPQVVVTEPAAEVTGDPGLAVEVRVVVTSGTSALTDLRAEVVFGAGPDVTIATGFDDQGGAEQVFTWDTTGVADGVYRVTAHSTANGQMASSSAAGLVRLGQLAAPPGLVSEGGGGFLLPTAIASAPDGSLVLLAQLLSITPAVLGAGTPNEVVLDPTAGVNDTVFARYGPDGALLWVRRTEGVTPTARLGGPSTRVDPKSVACDPDGSSVVLVALDGTAVFAPGEAAEEELTSADTDGTMLVQIRLDADGQTQWLRALEPVRTASTPPIVVVMPDGATIVTAQLNTNAGDVVLGAGEPNETTISPLDSAGGFLARYDTGGALDWARPFVHRAAPGAASSIDSLAATPSGELLVAGWFYGSVVFGEGANAIPATAPGDAQRVFVATLDGQGELVWLTLTDAPDTTFVWVRGVAHAGPSGDVALLGIRYYGPLTLDSGLPSEVTLDAGSDDGTLFLARFDDAGVLEWAKDVGIEDGETTFSNLPKGLAVTPEGELLVADGFDSDHDIVELVIDPDGASPQSLFVPADSTNLVLARFDAAGELVWARLDGGEGGEALMVDVVTRTNGAFTVAAWATNGDVVFGAGGPNEVAVPPGDFVALPTYSEDGELLETPGLEKLGARGVLPPFPHPTPRLAPVLPARPGAR